MSKIAKNIIKIKMSIPDNVVLVAVSKNKSTEDIKAAYNSGQRIFGENKVQEMVEKHNSLPKDIQWHFVGHLQSNKIKYMAHFVDLIHGVDKFYKLEEIDKLAKKNNRIIRCLLQVKIAKEKMKFGLSVGETEEIISSKEVLNLKNIEVEGFMGMATFTDNFNQIKKEFSFLKNLFDNFKIKHSSLKTLSMGMSKDYQLAILNGSNMIRVGSSIFGLRN